MNPADIPIFAPDLMRLLGIKHPNTLRQYIKEGKVPAPSVKITQKNRYWHRSSLVQAGLLQPDAALPAPGAGMSQSAQA